MADLVQQQGKIEKVKFIGYSDVNFDESKKVGEYVVMFNPSNIAVKFQVERGSEQPPGSTGTPQPFVRTKPQDYSFEFIIDSTGAAGVSRDVPEDVLSFLSVVYDYVGTDHKPNYVKIVYGSVLLKCVLKSADVTYNLFSPNGKPLRAKINASFSSCADPQLNEAIKATSSPDMTHARKLQWKDKLISIANKIYKNNNFYLEVARANQFDTFRNLPEGTEIFFPPVNKKNINNTTTTNA